MAGMVRRLWIIGLAFAFWFYLAVAVGIAAALIRHPHPDVSRWIIFVADAYVAWLTYKILRQRISADRRKPIPTANPTP
jgi:threonine/homoserine/homoserine lactone efflux protein